MKSREKLALLRFHFKCGFSVIRCTTQRETRVFVADQCGIRGVSLRNPAVNPCRDAGHPARSRAETAIWRGKPGPHARPAALGHRQDAAVALGGSSAPIHNGARLSGKAGAGGGLGIFPTRRHQGHQEGAPQARPLGRCRGRLGVSPSCHPVVQANGPPMPCRGNDRFGPAHHPPDSKKIDSNQGGLAPLGTPQEVRR